MLIECDLIIINAEIYTGLNEAPSFGGVAVKASKIICAGDVSQYFSKNTIDAQGLALSPGFIDVHTHDDLEVFRNPHMLCKVSQGITTVIAGNCGISATPYKSSNQLVDPINLLGTEDEFKFESLSSYISTFETHNPSVNLGMLIGHTSLRAQALSDLTMAATKQQIDEMKGLLEQALSSGALGLSTGLAYKNAQASSFEEVLSLVKCLSKHNGIYTTHLRTEFDAIIEAMDEAFSTAKTAGVPLVISHLKCAGKNNWGRAKEVLNHLKQQRSEQDVSCDCYPYSASSSTLDLNQVTEDNEIFITWSDTYPDMAQKTLCEIANIWNVDLLEAAKRLQPAGAVYHCMQESDVSTIVSDPVSMIGSDGLPCDPHPHPRLWGSFPRVLGKYCRDEKALNLPLAIHKMTALPSGRFNLHNRGVIKSGYFADLVLFNPKNVTDNASFINPKMMSSGISHVWVNGILSFEEGCTQESIQNYGRAGQFLARRENKEVKQ